MRDDVLMELVRLVRTDADFRQAILADPDAALQDHGFRLTSDELAAVHDVHAELAQLSPQQAHDRLAGATAGEGFA